MAAERKRLDILLAERGIFASRSEAKAAIKAGLVSIDGQRAEKPGMQVRSDAVVEVKELPRYVSRGGLKLEKALSCFGIDLAGRTAMDVGASTGGFTDCMLQHGAAKVYSIDVDTINLTGDCARTGGWYCWKEQTYAICRLRQFRKRWILRQLMYPSFPWNWCSRL